MADGREPGGRRTARGRRGPGRLIALGALVLILLGHRAGSLVALLQPFKGDGGKTVRVTIPQGSSLSQIADRLEKSGVIDDAGFFQLRARIGGDSGNLRPGSYELREDMSLRRRARRAQGGRAAERRPGGHPRGPLAQGDPPAHQRPARQLHARHAPLARRSTRATTAPSAPRSLEGFLFPATYELKKGQPVTRLREQQLAQFKRNFEKVDLGFAKRKNLNAVRRADHRVADRARGDGGEGAPDHRVRDLQPPARRHPARHRRHHALRGRATGSAR